MSCGGPACPASRRTRARSSGVEVRVVKLYQCPIGHPPGPQEFCPIRGRRCDPVEAAPPPPPPPPAAQPPAAQPPSTSWDSGRTESDDEAPTRAFNLDEPTEGSPPPPLPPAPGAAPPPPSPPPGS